MQHATPAPRPPEARSKLSLRFYNNCEVRAIWDDAASKWRFSVLDIIAAINNEPDYSKSRNYWKWLKAKLKRENSQLVSATTQLKLTSPDGKRRDTDVLDADGVVLLAKKMPNERATAFLDWFLYSENTIDGQSKKKAYTLFESGLLENLEPGTVKSLQQIHAYLFGGLYDFAGLLRSKNISKGGFMFASALHFPSILPAIERMPESSFDEIVDKYVEMNIAHPFMEGNGRATRIWLDLMLKRTLKKCIDWSRVDKRQYLEAMRRSVADSATLKALLAPALTDKIDDRETFMKGIDYSYYYEEPEGTQEPEGAQEPAPRRRRRIAYGGI